MKIATEPAAVEGTNDDDAAGTVLHAAEVTHDVAEAMKESEPEPELEASESEVPKTEKGETSSRPAKRSDASKALQAAARVFEDAENFGAKFESFWNRLFSCYCAYDENSEFELPPNLALFSINFIPQLATMIYTVFCDVTSFSLQ
jgi:hypothetical protein